MNHSVNDNRLRKGKETNATTPVDAPEAAGVEEESPSVTEALRQLSMTCQLMEVAPIRKYTNLASGPELTVSISE